MLKETKVVLKRLDTQRQLMQPPLPATLKKRLAPRKTHHGSQKCGSFTSATGCQSNATRYVPSEQSLDLQASSWCRCFQAVPENWRGHIWRSIPNWTWIKASAIKIVPIEGSFPVNGENQKTAAQILPEAITGQELSALSQKGRNTICPNFIEVKRLYYIQDRYHPALLKQWDAFDSKRASENDRPDCFKADQKFIMFQFADGGTSLEDYEINSATEARSIFLQVACALAVAETALEFEHRDLHWGNILVAPTKQRHIHCHLPEGTFSLETSGVLASVIDYTLSRLRKGSQVLIRLFFPLCQDGAVIYTDASHENELFGGVGDYQFDIYRRMKEHNQ
ncbi:serine/threonine-protein kinase haspin-like [Dermacentor albipictus]|uniref:serine/threonine-protein kinase haspin-like n=1 Tax=Dermacentor albipictus TaxID=60249 RepID=UPI0038FD057E